MVDEKKCKWEWGEEEVGTLKEWPYLGVTLRSIEKGKSEGGFFYSLLRVFFYKILY